MVTVGRGLDWIEAVLKVGFHLQLLITTAIKAITTTVDITTIVVSIIVTTATTAATTVDPRKHCN